jgi:limonene-1,2-epoxide hydrolase
VLDTAAKGPVVINNRIDRLTRTNGPNTDVYFLGVFFVQSGRIVEWIDYSVAPGTPVKPGQPL